MIKLRPNIRKILPFNLNLRQVSEHGIAFAAGFITSMSRLLGSMSPFSAALIAAAGKSTGITALAGSCLGFLLRFDSAWTARMIAVTLAAAALNYIIHHSHIIRPNAYTAPIIAGGCMLLSGLAVLLAQGFNTDGLILYICESILCAGAAAVFETALNSQRQLVKKEPLSEKQLTCVTVCVCIMLLSVESFELEGISPARSAAVLTVLCAAKWLGISGGSICGGAMGFAMSLGSSYPFLSGSYTFGGLICGMLAPLGRLTQAAAFSISSAVIVLANTGETDLMPALYETALATVAFVAMPQKFFTFTAVYFAGRKKLPEFETMKKAVLLRLKSLQAGMEDISDAVEEIARNMVKLDKSAENTLSNEIKQLVRDQFSTFAMAINDISGQFEQETRFDTATAAKIAFVLESYSINPNEVICSETAGISRIEINAQRLRGKFSRSALMNDMEAACGYKLNNPTVREESNSTMLTFIQKPRLSLRIGKAQFTADESSMCGDNCDIFTDKNGNQIIVISDGMGTGPRAAVDGAVASWLFAKLLIAGLNFDSALRLSNSTLIVKSQEETVATIDAVRIDLHTGKTEFFKAGATISLVCKGRKIYRFGKPSMPLGILREVEFVKEHTTLSGGDILLMMSDGVNTGCYGKIADEMRNFNKKDPSDLAERVIEIAKSYNSGNHEDDITVIAAIIG